MEFVRSHSSYISPKLEARAIPAKGGYGIYARQPVAVGELLIVWGGKIYDEAGLETLPPARRMHSVQVEEGLYLVSHAEFPAEEADFLNHSCTPNTGFMGQISLISLRDIQPDEEICIDYAMCDGSPYDEFTCACGAPDCRGQVTGNDWRKPDLQARYRGYFIPYLQRRIESEKTKPGY